MNQLTPLGRLIFLDRYALKSQDRSSVKPGQEVVVCLDPNAKHPQRELAHVSEVNCETVKVKLTNSGDAVELHIDQLDVPIEAFEEATTRLARAFASVESTDETTTRHSNTEFWFRKFEGILRNGFVPAGRVWAGAGVVEQLTVYNCYCIPAPKDSRHGILETLSRMIEIMSRGGGVGIPLMTLRPRYSIVHGVNGRSSGSVSWAQTYSFHTGLIEQGGSRRGALMLIQYDWHPDILEFIDAKRKAGVLENSNVSVAISDAFMEAVQKDLDWELKFPDTKHPTYDAEWVGDINKWEAKGYPVKVYRTLKARELWNRIVVSAHASAEPGLFFVDRYNTMANSNYYPQGKIWVTNPCVTGDTLVAVADGRQAVPIKQLAEEELDVPVFCSNADGKPFVRWGRKPRKTGTKEVLRIELEDGSFLRTTADHKIMLRDGTYKTTTKLQPGDSLMPFIKGRYVANNRDDWWVNDYTNPKWVSLESHVVAEFVEGRSVKPFPEEVAHHKDGDHWNNDWRNVEAKSNSEHSQEHSAGPNNAMFGKKHKASTKQKIAVASQSRFSSNAWKRSFGQAVRTGMQNSPLRGKIGKHVRTQSTRTTISSNTGKQIANELLYQGKWLADTIGQLDAATWDQNLATYKQATGSKRAYRSYNIDNYFDSWRQFKRLVKAYNHKVVSVDQDGIEDVYNITVDEFHNFAVVTNLQHQKSKMKWPRMGGVIVKNCGEQGLPAFFDGDDWGGAICNLGHLYLPDFLIGDGMGVDPAQVDWKKLEEHVPVAIRFMDNLIDIAYTPYEKITEFQKNERRIGFGTMGLHEMLIRCHVRYGNNPECLQFLDKLFRKICELAYMTSCKLAEERGPFPWYQPKLLMTSGFAQQLPEHIRKEISKHGLRNVTLLTQAPTGTVGTMMNTSTGIEPFPWWSWERMGQLGNHVEHVKVLQDYYEANPHVLEQRLQLKKAGQFKTSKHLPPWFVCSAELSPEDHAYTQAAIQRWVDSSISKTSNLPNEYTPAEVGEYYQLLYSLGCKGGTVYRDGSRHEQVLNLPVEEEEAVEPSKFIELFNVPEDVYHFIGVPIRSAFGKVNVKLGIHPTDNKPFEVWVDLSKAGSAANADREAIARLMSLIMRINSPVRPLRRLQLIIDQLAHIHSGRVFGFGTNKVHSIPDAIAKGLQKLLAYFNPQGELQEAPEGTNETSPSSTLGDICPNCGNATVALVDGCEKCCSCSWSLC